MNAQPLPSTDPGIAATRDSDTIIVDDATLTSARIYARHLFPAHGAHVYLLLELIALFPAEVRTICRIVRRSRRQRRQQMEGQGQGRRLLGAGSSRGVGGRRPVISLHEVALFVIKVSPVLSPYPYPSHPTLTFTTPTPCPFPRLARSTSPSSASSAKQSAPSLATSSPHAAAARSSGSPT